MDELNDVRVIETQGLEIFEAQERAAIDIQVNTAKRFPRELRRVLENSIVIATLDKETAKSCRYAKPVGGQDVTGPSVHLARIICQQYGNIRVQQRIKQIDARSVVAEAVAFDLETNYAVCVEARRSIIDRHGNRYSDSVIETNAMAILAIAERNAVLKVIPRSITEKVYNEAFKFAFGDLSDSAKLLKERERIFKTFKNEYGINEEAVIKCVGLKAKGAIKAEHIADLQGYLQALTDKELTPEDIINKGKPTKTTIEEKKKNLKGKRGQSTNQDQGQVEPGKLL